MFRQLQNIDSAFKHVRLFSFVLIAACMVICCYAIFESYRMVTTAQERIYLLANGKAIEALAADRKDNIPVEARDHIGMFHHYFFSLDPDDKVIEANIKKALYLADGSAKKQYDDLKEGGYYSGIISGNVSQEIVADSITLNMDAYPYYFKYYGVQKMIRPTAIVSRSLIADGYLRNVARSDNNSHGFLIERWRILDNKDLEVQKR
ncbi:conjugative transposon protein TraK [Pedobacter borealis]|uniref:conjugative transposon protein TraK n=1 Tax=Pedobacter borealis TaxID=475254 RepID=UPI000493014F|nr:conjugative transposon protein TraK [Pedobacter borealis]